MVSSMLIDLSNLLTEDDILRLFDQVALKLDIIDGDVF